MAGLSDTALMMSRIITEGIVAEDAPVRRICVGVGHAGGCRNYPDLAQGEGHALAKLVLPGNGVLKERRLYRRQVVVGLTCGIENGLIGQVGCVQGELRIQPVGEAHLLDLGHGSGSRPPRCLIQKAGGSARGYGLTEGGLNRKRHPQT